MDFYQPCADDLADKLRPNGKLLSFLEIPGPLTHDLYFNFSYAFSYIFWNSQKAMFEKYLI